MSVVFDFNDPRLQLFPQILEEAIKEVVTECIDQAVWMAKAIVPVQTGALQSSIRREGDLTFVAGGDGFVNPRSGRVVDYAVFVEAKYPFMKASWAMASSGIEEKIKQRVLERLK